MSVLVRTRLPDELKQLRERAGLTRRALAELAGVSDGAIKLLEYGQSAPKPETLRLLARGLSTNRLAGTPDPEQSEAIYRQLMAAAGLMPEGDDADALPADIVAKARELVGTDEGLFRALLADLVRRTPENRREAMRFLAQALDFGQVGASHRAGRP